MDQNNMNNGYNNMQPNNPNMGYNQNMGGVPPMGGAPFAPRNVVTAIVLSLVTCGIYGIYWWIKMTDETNSVTPNPGRSGAMCFLFTIITCGIYGVYWYYMMGKNLYAAGQARGVNLEDRSIVYLLLGIVGLGIVSEAMMQSDLNRLANGN